MITRLLSILTALAAFGSIASANNLHVTNVVLRPITSHSLGIQFDLSWDNSWRDECNHDAAWVFAKYSLDGGTNWLHATLQGSGTNPVGYATGTFPNLEIVVPSDRKGAFVRPTATERGTLATTNMLLVWDLAADGVPATARGRVSVQGLEMVYIPAGPFYVGDNSSVGNGTGGGRSFAVTYINTPVMTNGAASGAGTIASPYTNLTIGIGRPYGITGTFSTNYPNGYNAFYIMKYELSRARYLAFLNLLTTNQAATLRNQQANFQGLNGTIAAAFTNTYPMNWTNVQPWRAVLFGTTSVTNPFSYSGSQEWFAYLDWAALRPMTEMEYEKAARGPLLPVDRGYPWGTASRLLVTRLTNSNTAAEAPLIRGANLLAGAGYGGTLGVTPPLLRNGASADAASDQFQAGASYYGVMDLAGNIADPCVVSGPAGNSGTVPAAALAYSGAHGDGLLNTNGIANATNWPYQSAVSYGGGTIGKRGGDYGTPSLGCTISARVTDNYYTSHGIRAVRTAP